MTLRVCCGVDLVDIARIERMAESGGMPWLRSVWTADEISYSVGRSDRLASRWAAKEAALKAFGWRIGEVDLVDVEVRASSGDQPTLKFHGSALVLLDGFRLQSVALSLAHEAGFAIAQVSALVEDR